MRSAVSSAVALTLLLAPAARAQRHPSYEVEDSYRGALKDLAAGSVGQAVSRVVELEERSSPKCLQVIELRMAELLAKRDPESLVAQALLRIALQESRHHEWSRAANLFEFERVSIRALQELGDLYVTTSRHSDARSIAAGLLTHMAHLAAAARSAPRLEAASDILEAAVGVDPDHPTARYSLTEALELLGRPEQALQHLERLLDIEPEDPRLRVRRALLTVKSGRHERGQQLLEELTTDGPIWARDLATQELARLLSGAGREDEAVRLVRQGLAELPREKLSLQLAALLDPQWIDSWDVLGAWLDTARRDAGPSARWIYEDEDGVTEKRVALRRVLGSAAAERSAALKSALRRTPVLSDKARKTVAAVCWLGRDPGEREEVPDRGPIPVGPLK